MMTKHTAVRGAEFQQNVFGKLLCPISVGLLDVF